MMIDNSFKRTSVESASATESRRVFFAEREGGRYWWHRVTGDSFVPDVYRILTEEEWSLLTQWYEDTDEKVLVGECAVPLVGWLTSHVSSNSISRVVQLGTYAGYSTLLLGWALRRMGNQNSLVAVDIDAQMCTYTESWLARAGLDDTVKVHVGDSSAPELPAICAEYLGGSPQLVFLDSSHQYEHTLRELDLWYDALLPGSMIALHDVSAFASAFDSTNAGGVRRALSEWSAARGVSAFSLEFAPYSVGQRTPAYLDTCGVGLILRS